jgi:hypothetical protein
MSELAEYGVAIVAIGALVVVALAFLKFIRNHVSESTKASQRLADMIEQMLTFLVQRNGRD